MPSGVEHYVQRASEIGFTGALAELMPSGVEHISTDTQPHPKPPARSPS